MDQQARSKPSNLNLPNTVTGVRILATPFVLWLLLADNGAMGEKRWWGAGLFILFMASDAFDGYWARSRGLVTDLGKLLDPIADKVLTGGALIVLSVLHELPWWVTIVILVREIGITVHRLLQAHVNVVAAAWLGKLKTVAQSIAIPLLLIPHVQWTGAFGYWLNVVAIGIAFVLTLVSGIDYLLNLRCATGRPAVADKSGAGR